nr:peptidoglycan-binding protein [Sinobaca qinghaiensis]
MKKIAISTMLAAILLFTPTMADAALGDQTLRQGMRHSDVSELQRWLSSKGFQAGAADGIFGAQTGNALKSYQRSAGLGADGIAGPQTFSKMKVSASGSSSSNVTKAPAASAGSSTLYRVLRQGSRGNDVKTLQQSLNSKGFNSGTADGVFGARTTSAVRSFQSAAKLSVDGVAGARTFNALKGNIKASSSGNGTQVSGTTAPAPASSGFIVPASGRISSEFGSRNGSSHHGIDVAQGNRSNVSIAASASGTVTSARFMTGYGNTVIVSHTIGGRHFNTLYAHLKSFNVSPGQSVRQGQTIGIMGSTGRSSGPHLHFEIHEGSWNVSKSNVVNPRKYISF